ncbi:hypothetical protein BDW75DRAFT_115456 [Aspergillus navahoensis]
MQSNGQNLRPPQRPSPTPLTCNGARAGIGLRVYLRPIWVAHSCLPMTRMTPFHAPFLFSLLFFFTAPSLLKRHGIDTAWPQLRRSNSQIVLTVTRDLGAGEVSRDLTVYGYQRQTEADRGCSRSLGHVVSQVVRSIHGNPLKIRLTSPSSFDVGRDLCNYWRCEYYILKNVARLRVGYFSRSYYGKGAR